MAPRVVNINILFPEFKRFTVLAIQSDVHHIETDNVTIVKLTEVLTKGIGYWIMAGNGCSVRCLSTDVCIMVHGLGGPGQRTMGTILIGISSNTPLLDSWKQWL